VCNVQCHIWHLFGSCEKLLELGTWLINFLVWKLESTTLCHYRRVHPGGGGGGGGRPPRSLCVEWSVFVNILSKQSWTASKGWCSSLGVDRGW
jgi:hypothetical protein